MIAEAMEQHENYGILKEPTVEEIFEIRNSTEAWMKEKYHL